MPSLIARSIDAKLPSPHSHLPLVRSGATGVPRAFDPWQPSHVPPPASPWNTRAPRGGKSAAAKVGVQVGLVDYIAAAAAGILIASTMAAYAIAARIPVIRDAADRSLVRKLTKQLKRYGYAELTTNAATYRPART
jgi:hypothetical protein